MSSLEIDKLVGKTENRISQILENFNDAPLIGLEYLVEIIHKPNVEPTYECLLCMATLETKDVISDVVTARHRLKYLEKFYPTAYSKFAHEPNMEIWEQLTFDFLETVARRIEEKHGRLPVTVVTKADYDKNSLEFFVSRIDDGAHFKESRDLDFAYLPNVFNVSPFSYIPPESPSLLDGELLSMYFGSLLGHFWVTFAGQF